MARSNRAKLLAIYAELRTAGIEASAGELLRLANLILRSYGTDFDELDVFGRPRDYRAFFALPVDEALKDGGWKVLSFEAHRGFDIEEIDPQDVPILKQHIQKFLGPQWQQQIPED